MADPRNKPIERILTVPNPGDSNEISVTPDTAAGWLFTTLRLTLTTGAAVPVRAISVAVSKAGIEYVRMGTATTQAASLTRAYSAAMGASMIVDTLAVRSIDWPVNGIWVPQGHTLATVTDGLTIGDTFTEIAARIIEFPTGPRFLTWPFVVTLTEESS